jgi:hypothetical protein
MTWQALVKEGGLHPDNAALTVAMVVDGTSSTGSFIKSDIIVRSTGSFIKSDIIVRSTGSFL